MNRHEFTAVMEWVARGGPAAVDVHPHAAPLIASGYRLPGVSERGRCLAKRPYALTVDGERWMSDTWFDGREGGMGHPNADVLRRAYAVRDRAEVDPLRQWLHDDVVWHAESGDLHGPQAVMAMLAEADRIVDRSQSHEIRSILADDDYGVVLNTVRAVRADAHRSYEDLHVHVYRFRDGRIIEFWGFLHDPQAAAAFWA